MHQGGVEEVLPYNPKLSSPKKEEDEPMVEDMMISADSQIDVMKEIESILGIADKQKSKDNMFGGSEWDFMEFEGFAIGKKAKEETGEQYNKRPKMEDQSLLEECDDHNHVSVVVKRENLGFWEEEKKTISLNLNYQEVLDAWSDGRSPWADDCSLSTANEVFIGEVPIMEEERRRREARVLRYKEKRQSRLFSKKIRYQVRKLNAEKRPRLKGRFVKRIPDTMLR